MNCEKCTGNEKQTTGGGAWRFAVGMSWMIGLVDYPIIEILYSTRVRGETTRLWGKEWGIGRGWGGSEVTEMEKGKG